jgi:thiol-disulfide isomerase/thioredoxin
MISKYLLLPLIFISASGLAQKRINGKITDIKSGEPVSFASVGILGTFKGTSANVDGEFSILVSDDETLKITCVGYESVTISSLTSDVTIKLKQATTQLSEVIVSNKRLTAKDIVKNAFKNVPINFNSKAFNQKFFYRHYCRDDTLYGRLIEAAVEIHKKNGYSVFQRMAGEREGIGVTQLRRSLDKTKIKSDHVPISIESILECDVAGYQMRKGKFYSSYRRGTISSLLKDVANYDYKLEGITNYDGQEVFEISYKSLDSTVSLKGALYTINYKAQFLGKVFITTDKYAFVKTQNMIIAQNDTISTTAYYRPYGKFYYPYHFVEDGKIAKDNHWFHIEMMTTEVIESDFRPFKGKNLSREALSLIPFDSLFWDSYDILKTTPLEEKIVKNLGGEDSLRLQFAIYNGIEDKDFLKTKQDEQAFDSLRGIYNGKRIIYIDFWASWCGPCIAEFKAAKELQKRYKDKIVFVMLSVDDEIDKWQKALEKYDLKSGFYHFRIGTQSDLSLLYEISAIPRYIIVDKSGNHYDLNAKRPRDPSLKKDFDMLIQSEEK